MTRLPIKGDMIRIRYDNARGATVSGGDVCEVVDVAPNGVVRAKRVKDGVEWSFCGEPIVSRGDSDFDLIEPEPMVPAGPRVRSWVDCLRPRR